MLILVGMVLGFPWGRAVDAAQLTEHAPLIQYPQVLRSFQEESILFRQSGIASWYGPGFYGRKTASGERFRKDAFTCAHRSLPFGTKLLVINTVNQKSVEVVVNDRGPFVEPRILDLSYAAARELGILQTGTGHIQLIQYPSENRITRLESASQSQNL